MAIINPIWAYWIVNQRSPVDDKKACILGYTMESGIPQDGCSTCPEDRPDQRTGLSRTYSIRQHSRKMGQDLHWHSMSSRIVSGVGEWSVD